LNDLDLDDDEDFLDTSNYNNRNEFNGAPKIFVSALEDDAKMPQNQGRDISKSNNKGNKNSQ